MTTTSFPASPDAWAVLDTSGLDRTRDFMDQWEMLVATALRLVTPDRIVAVTLEQDSPWVLPLLEAYAEITHLALPVDRGDGVGLAVGALYLCRRNRAPRGWFLTGPIERNAFAVGHINPYAPRDLVKIPPAELPVAAYAGGADRLVAELAQLEPDAIGPLLCAHLGSRVEANLELSLCVPRIPYFRLGRRLDHLPHHSLRSSAPQVCHDEVRVAPSL